MKRFLSLAFTCGVVGAMVFALDRGQSAEPNRVADFMRLKLSHAQKLLESLAEEDFEAIVKHSQELSLLSQEASWKVLQTEEYLQHSMEFRRTAFAMKKAGEEKNLDGAALGYVDMTMKCVNCHKYVRGVRTAQRESSGHRSQ